MDDGFPRIMGCKFCGVLRNEHGRRWHVDEGWHHFHTPLRAQIKARWKEHMNAREANRRQQLIVDTLYGLRVIFTTNLVQELDPMQEAELVRLLDLGEQWVKGQQ